MTLNKKLITLISALLSILVTVGIAKGLTSVTITDQTGNVQDCDLDDTVLAVNQEMAHRGISQSSGLYVQEMRNALGSCYDHYFGAQTNQVTPTTEPQITFNPSNPPIIPITPNPTDIPTTSRNCGDFNCLKTCLQDYQIYIGSDIIQKCL